MDTLTSIADRRSVKHYDPTHEMPEAEIQQLMTEITSEDEAKIQLDGRELIIAKQFLDVLKSQSLEESLRHSRKPVLPFHSPIDSIVSIENAKKIYASARQPKSFVSIDQADHVLTRPEDAKFVAEVLAIGAKR